MLKEGGKIILSTENKTIYPSSAIWQSDLPPVHLWWFSEKSMAFIAEKLIMKINFTDFTNYKHGEPGTSIHSIPYNKHHFNEKGECTKEHILLPRNRFLRIIAQKYTVAYFLFIKLHHLYYSIRKRKYEILFDKRRAVMGCIFTK